MSSNNTANMTIDTTDAPIAAESSMATNNNNDCNDKKVERTANMVKCKMTKN